MTDSEALNQLREAVRVRHFSLPTEKSYLMCCVEASELFGRPVVIAAARAILSILIILSFS